MDKNQIFEFVKMEKAKGVDNTVIRTILLAKEYYESDIDEAIEAAKGLKGAPESKQKNPFPKENSVKKISWGKVLFLIIAQVGIVFASRLDSIKECGIKSNGSLFCSIYSVLLISFFVLPVLLWIIKFFFRKRGTYTLLIGTILSVLILTIIGLTK